jgi:hypothetical protein
VKRLFAILRRHRAERSPDAFLGFGLLARLRSGGAL